MNESGRAVVRTLVVDDEPDMRLLMRSTLEMDGCCVIIDEANDGLEALARWRQGQPDVVVLDMRMPGMTGLEMARMLSEQPGQAIVMCSAYMDQDDRDDARRIGVRSCIDKYDLSSLPAAVASSVQPDH